MRLSPLALRWAAVLPLAAPRFWESNRRKGIVTGLLAAPVLALLLARDPRALAHAAQEYASFIALLGSLFVISAGIFCPAAAANSSSPCPARSGSTWLPARSPSRKANPVAPSLADSWRLSTFSCNARPAVTRTESLPAATFCGTAICTETGGPPLSAAPTRVAGALAGAPVPRSIDSAQAPACG